MLNIAGKSLAKDNLPPGLTVTGSVGSTNTFGAESSDGLTAIYPIILDVNL